MSGECRHGAKAGKAPVPRPTRSRHTIKHYKGAQVSRGTRGRVRGILYPERMTPDEALLQLDNYRGSGLPWTNTALIRGVHSSDPNRE
jgi:hypothetical protein